MTTCKAVWLQCDAEDCENQWPPDLGSTNVAEVRAEARQRGWRLRVPVEVGSGLRASVYYVDYCPHHA